MKALSLRQPWARAVTHGLLDRRTGFHVWKPVENRDWRYLSSHRGPTIIHASKTYDREGAEWIRSEFPSLEVPTKQDLEAAGELGALVGGLNVRGCRSGHEVRNGDWPPTVEQWVFGRIVFALADPFWRAPPGPVRGMLGFFDLDPIEFAGTVWNELAAHLQRLHSAPDRSPEFWKCRPTEFLTTSEFARRVDS